MEGVLRRSGDRGREPAARSRWRGAGEGDRHDVGGLRQAIVDRYLVVHSAPVFLIDPQGVMRAVLTLPYELEELAHDVRLMLK